MIQQQHFECGHCGALVDTRLAGDTVVVYAKGITV
jgi:hypothetical protein